MFEKVNPCHPDKVADRIAGAIVDLCYTKCKNPKVACEVLIGHGECTLQIETSERLTDDPQAAAAASGEEDITDGGDNQGGSNGGGGNNNPPGELEE